MDPRLFAEWAEMDDRLRRIISARADGELAHGGAGDASGRRATWAPTGELLFVVSREDTKTFAYLKHAMEPEGVVDVVLDRRNGDRRRVRQSTLPDRRNGCRRRRDLTADLKVYGWALVHR